MDLNVASSDTTASMEIVLRTIPSEAVEPRKVFTSAMVDELLQMYNTLQSSVGPRKQFATKIMMFKFIASKLNEIFQTNISGEQCQSKFKLCLKQHRAAKKNNRTSGSARTEVPYAAEFEALRDDSITPRYIISTQSCEGETSATTTAHEEEDEPEGVETGRADEEPSLPQASSSFAQTEEAETPSRPRIRVSRQEQSLNRMVALLERLDERRQRALQLKELEAERKQAYRQARLERMDRMLEALQQNSTHM